LRRYSHGIPSEHIVNTKSIHHKNWLRGWKLNPLISSL
jgi:hypothetical protein